MILLLHAIVLLFGSVASTIVSAVDDDDVHIHQTMVRDALSSTMLLEKRDELSADLMEHINIQDTHMQDDEEEVTSLLNRVLKGQSTTQVHRATAQQRHRQKLKRRQSRTTKKKKAQTKKTSGNLLDYNGGNTLYYTPPTPYNNGRTKQSMNNKNVGRAKKKQGYNKKKKGGRIPSSYKKGYKKQSQQNIGNSSRPNNNTNRPNNSGGTFQQQQENKFLTMKNTGEGCLQSTNPYRTCLSSDGTSIVHTYNKPQVASNEEIVQGTMYLSLLQDSTPLSCNTNAVTGYAGVNTIEQMEELTLSYLADNVGYGRTGFGVVCVQVEERVYDKSSVQTRNSSGGRVKKNGDKMKNVFHHNNNKNDGRRQLQQREVVESNTLKLRVSYVQKIDTTTTGSSSRNLEQQEMEEEVLVNDEHEKELSVTTSGIIETKQQAQDTDQRSLQQQEEDNICTPLDRAQCCSQYSINNSPGQYCTKLGCNVLRCGTGRQRPRRGNNMFGRNLIGNVVEEVTESNEVEATNEIESVINRRLYPIPYSLKGSDYTTALRRQTVFNPKETWAQLDVENIENVAVCSVNRYSVEMVRHL